MPVDRQYGEVIYHCDGIGCHEYIETQERDMKVAVIIARENGWNIFKEDGGYVHLCHGCSDELNFDEDD